jgi:hypothetical protein
MTSGIKVRLFRQRTIWCPTWLGWLCLGLPLVAVLVWWSVRGESYLSLTSRVGADVLVVEAWIGREGMQAAKEEYEAGGYCWLVATGGLTRGGWIEAGGSYAAMAEEEWLRLGLPREKVLAAPSKDPDSQRTFQSALAVRRLLEARGLPGTSVNVLTRGPHARRSRNAHQKAFGKHTAVGVIAWNPEAGSPLPWWRSSERAKEMLTETAGYLYEGLLDSGRWFLASSEDAVGEAAKGSGAESVVASGS